MFFISPMPFRGPSEIGSLEIISGLLSSPAEKDRHQALSLMNCDARIGLPGRDSGLSLSASPQTGAGTSRCPYRPKCSRAWLIDLLQVYRIVVYIRCFS